MSQRNAIDFWVFTVVSCDIKHIVLSLVCQIKSSFPSRASRAFASHMTINKFIFIITLFFLLSKFIITLFICNNIKLLSRMYLLNWSSRCSLNWDDGYIIIILMYESLENKLSHLSLWDWFESSCYREKRKVLSSYQMSGGLQENCLSDKYEIICLGLPCNIPNW